MRKAPAPATLTIVMPVYNEAASIRHVIEAVYNNAVRRISGCQLLIAEDGSTDGTKEVIRQLRNEIPFTLSMGVRRKGYTKAFIDAMRLAETDLVFFCDSDGQHDPNDIPLMLQHIEKHDIVGGYKIRRQDPWYRVVISRIYNTILSLLFKTRVRDANSGFKLIRRQVIDSILTQLSAERKCVMGEFIIRSIAAGFRFKEIPVTHYPRSSGSSAAFVPSKLPFVAARIFLDTLRLKRELDSAGFKTSNRA